VRAAGFADAPTAYFTGGSGFFGGKPMRPAQPVHGLAAQAPNRLGFLSGHRRKALFPLAWQCHGGTLPTALCSYNILKRNRKYIALTVMGCYEGASGSLIQE
jgi:hypothetical protein